ncbi:MAG: hypothetical protein J6F30_13440 [Cellulosilyticum sp.]|nr:hypothetical protein [Cellulosilyticum sp.]
MKIINLKGLDYDSENIRILHYNGESVLLATQRIKQDVCWYEVIRYCIETEQIKLIYTYKIPEHTFWIQRARVVGDKIICTKGHFENQIEIEVIHQITGEILTNYRIHTDEPLGCTMIYINEHYFIFATDIEELEGDKYQYFKENGIDYIYYLADLVEGRVYPIRQVNLLKGLTVIHGLIDEMPRCKQDGKDYVLFNECYMEDYEYEEIYHLIKSGTLNQAYVKEKEGLYIIELEELISSIKENRPFEPFQILGEHYNSGWVRYIERKNNLIYYRIKDFETTIERIYQMDIDTLSVKEIKQIEHKKYSGNLIYGADRVYQEEYTDRVYLISEIEGTLNVKIPRKRGMHFKGYIDERYMIVTWFIDIKDDNDEWDTRDFVMVYDFIEDTIIEYESGCEVFKDILLLY